MKQDPFSTQANQPVETPILIPELGAKDKPIAFIMWLVEREARVISSERIAEILVDSTVVHLEAPVSGTLSEISCKPRQLVTVGESIGVIRSLTSERDSDFG